MSARPGPARHAMLTERIHTSLAPVHLELEDASSKKSAKHAELLQKVEDYEALNVKRLQRIHTLEAQLKQARYSTGKSKLRSIDEDDRSETTESTNLLLAELNEGDLAVFVYGGHGYEILEDDTKIIETKNGPFTGVENDKVKF